MAKQITTTKERVDIFILYIDGKTKTYDDVFAHCAVPGFVILQTKGKDNGVEKEYYIPGHAIRELVATHTKIEEQTDE